MKNTERSRFIKSIRYILVIGFYLIGNVYSMGDTFLEKNIIHNPSFEEKDLSAYQYQFWEGNGEIELATAPVHSGKQCLKVTALKNASATVWQEVDVEKNTVYKISFWLYTKNLSGKGITGLEIKANTPYFKAYHSIDHHPNDDQWHLIEVYTHTGDATKLEVILMFEAWNGGGTGTAYYDDISVVPIAHSEGAYFIHPDRPLPPGITLTETADPPYNDEFDTMEGYPVDKFKPTLDSLKQYKCPDWFRDAKFGIYLHWGVYSLAEQECWFPRLMYNEGYNEFKYMRDTYGHQSAFGYKDLIPLWKAEKFDPEQLVALFKRAGAKYITPVAIHHDNFDLWDSQYHKWNSVNMGPKKDITGMWREAILKQGLRFGVTSHLAWSYSWFGVNKGADTKGKYQGVPYDGNDPKYWDFYHEPNGERGFYPINPTAKWRYEWALRTMDLIDKYHPDLLYFDGAIPFNGIDQSRTGMEVIAYYYNRNMQWHNGELEGVMTLKQGADGVYVDGVATLDFERGKSDVALPEPWQTDDSIGPWAYLKGAHYKSVDEIVDKLVDIVSRNGNYLLNVPPRADGTLDDKTIALLEGIGKWMDVNGEAIYGTRPWIKVEEGNIRFTKKGNILYAICLDWPGDAQSLKISSLALSKDTLKIKSVSLLGFHDTLVWKQDKQGLMINLPKEKPGENAWSFKIQFGSM
ncbi:MAG: alpha-L-fucosidase [bacterium]